MSKVTLALGSFIVGACCALIISLGIQTSTWAQPVFNGGEIVSAKGSGIVLPDAEPTVPAVKLVTLNGTKLSAGTVQQLDGLDCESCVLKSPELTYSGGLYRLMNPKISALQLSFKGPAANTVVLLAQLGAFRKPAPQGAPSPFKPPILHEAKADTVDMTIIPIVNPTSVTLTSLSVK